MIKVYIIDDHFLLREGIKKIINDETDIIAIGESSDGVGILDYLSVNEVNLIIMDISLPGRSGLDILKDIKCKFKDIPVLILSMHPEDRYAIRALKNGAAGYLTKDSVPEELVAAIRKIYNGGKYISSSLGEKLADSLEEWSDRPIHENLSDREYQVMLMIASGKKITVISDELILSPATINTYRARILEKMNFKSNVDLTRYVVENHLLD